MIRCLLLFLAISTSALGQQVIEGRVVDSQTGQPIPFVSIGIMGTSRGTSSNLQGQFSLSLTEPFSVKISCVGYESQIITTVDDLAVVQLKPTAIELSEVVVTNRKTIDAKRIVKRAFSNVSNNYSTKPFLQKFFYRHYCKDDAVYGRLIEAFVDVWKQGGYQSSRIRAGDKEEIRVMQLRRSLDRTIAAQGHEPIAVGNILHADIVGYQLREKKSKIDFFNTVSNIKSDFTYYTFTYDAITVHDGQEVYLISYESKKDSVLTTSGYKPLPHASGTLYITTSDYAIIKAEQEKTHDSSTIETAAFYRKYGNRYYPYHFIQQGRNDFADGTSHQYHVELVTTEVLEGYEKSFTGKLPTKDELMQIQYDPVYWKNAPILKTTPLEDEIISDLGGGASLHEQFELYQKYEWSLSDGGNNAEEKFTWFKEFNKDKQMLYLVFWNNPCDLNCVRQLEEVKRLHKLYRNQLTVVLLSLENDVDMWKQLVAKYNLFSDGIVNYRIGDSSRMLRLYKIKKTPAHILLLKNGEVFQADDLPPAAPVREADIKLLINTGK
ncbi:MAG: carboxypeptidase-like regulatory domain-containing protein [Cyclobacteriaceae bacterium]|nr:carboxypeptidase-like regulatory domain-containing protein [Cyclobacteriaceae bacterium]